MDSDAAIKSRMRKARAAALLLAVAGLGLLVPGIAMRNWWLLVPATVLNGASYLCSLRVLRQRTLRRYQRLGSVTLDRARAAGWVAMDTRIAANRRRARWEAVGAVVATAALGYLPLWVIARYSIETTPLSIGVLLALPVLAVIFWYWWYRSGSSVRRVLRRMRARPVPADATTDRLLHDLILAAGLDHAPSLYVVDAPVANAFAVGSQPRRVRSS